MRVEVLARDSVAVLAAYVECCCCGKLVHERDADVWEENGKENPCCIPCVLYRDGYGDPDPGPGLPSQLSYEPSESGWSSYDDVAQSDEYEWDRRAGVA